MDFVEMKIPVFSSGKGVAVVKQSEIKLKQDENNYQLTKQGLKLQEVQLKNTLESALKKRELQKENSRLAEKIYKNALNKEKIGNGNNSLSGISIWFSKSIQLLQVVYFDTRLLQKFSFNGFFQRFTDGFYIIFI